MKEHGKFDVTQEGKTLILSVSGSTNVEAIAYVWDKLNDGVASFNYQDFAILVDALDWDLSVKGSEENIIPLQKWLVSNNQKYEAVVCHASSIKHQQISLLQAAKKEAVDCRIFDSLDEARSWLNKKGML